MLPSRRFVLKGTYQSAGQVTITGNILTCTGNTASAIILGDVSGDPTYGNVKDCVLTGNTIVVSGTGSTSHVIECDGIDSCVIADDVVIATATSSTCGIAGERDDGGGVMAPPPPFALCVCVCDDAWPPPLTAAEGAVSPALAAGNAGDEVLSLGGLAAEQEADRDDDGCRAGAGG